MLIMVTPRIKPSVFFQDPPDTDLFVQAHRQAKLGSYVANLAAMDGLIDFSAVAQSVETACPRAERSKGGRPPYASEVMVRMEFLQALYNLSDEECEHQMLDRMSFQRFAASTASSTFPMRARCGASSNAWPRAVWVDGSSSLR